RIPIYAKQSLLKRRFQILSPIKQKFETIENSLISKVKPVVNITDKMNSFKKSYWIDDLNNHVKTKSTSSQRNSNSAGKVPKRELKVRKMTDSYEEEILPFKSDPELLEEYVNPYGSIRIGKIFENLDLLAGQIAYKHCSIEMEQNSDLTIVTASLDRLDLIKPLPISDIRLSGHITYVGYSSMEALIKIEALKDEKSDDDHIKGDTLMMARVVMKLFQITEEQKNRRFKSAATALSKLPPTEEEKLIIHDCYLEHCKYAEQKEKTLENMKWMDETIMESVTLMQPQKRSLHGFIFGGYLMKLAYELAFSNASVFLKSRPTFLALDEISFRKPVHIGSILIMTSQIVYAPGPPHKSFQVA
ncbi:8794_t:CDS:10, partial [Funneliformis mosseae]